MKGCEFCERIKQIKGGEQPPDLIAEFKTGYLFLSYFQFFEGYVIFVSKKHVEDLDELDPKTLAVFTQEMLMIHHAVRKAMKPAKMNVASLGNGIRHLHWHIIPRGKHDPEPHNPIWQIPYKVWKVRTTPKHEQQIINKIHKALA